MFIVPKCGKFVIKEKKNGITRVQMPVLRRFYRV